MINLEKAKPFLIGAGILGLGYFAIKYMQANASTDSSVPDSSENAASPFSLPVTTPDSSADISTYPTIGPAAPISINDTPSYLTYNYGNPASVLNANTYQPNDANATTDSCCSDCSDSCDTGSTNNNPMSLINSIPKSTVDAQVANAYSANIGAQPNYTDNYDATPIDTYSGILGNGATNQVKNNHIVNQYVNDPVIE